MDSDRLSRKFKQCRILVVGDIMLDQYLWGDVKRISPEAPVPVFTIRNRSEVTGGAGNVVSNLIGLECSVSIIGVRGEDEAGRRLQHLLQHERIQDLTIGYDKYSTITKTRIVTSGQQLLRLDEERIIPLSETLREKVLKAVNESIDDVDAVILSDYGKGLLQTRDLLPAMIKLARRKDIPIFVDPKGNDWSAYSGATCITPNMDEFSAVCGRKFDREDNLQEAMQNVMVRYDLDWLLVTRGPEGMSLKNRTSAPVHIPAQVREVYDVSGAGDTVIATLALGAACKLNFSDAARMANLAAGIVVGKVGTQPVKLLELKAAFELQTANVNARNMNKLASINAAGMQIDAWRGDGDTIVFTNGCFDLLHPGHISLLHQASSLGKRLIVGLNSDASVRRLKGAKRPILSEQDRAAILGSLRCVDLVVLFDEDTPENLIRALRPDILVKGADYRLDQVVGREIVESYGGHVRLVDILKGYSTTKLTEKMMTMKSPESQGADSLE